MIRQGTLGASTVKKTTIYRRAAACALAGGVLGLGWPASAAEAARTPRDTRPRLVADHNNDGNGHHNATALSVRSPTRNRGYQHTTNRNAGGVSDAQNALCHNVRVCNVRQAVTVVSPEKTTAPPVEATPPVTTTPVSPQARTAPGDPLVSLGPYGLTVMGAGSAGPASGGEAGPFDCPPNLFW